VEDETLWTFGEPFEARDEASVSESGPPSAPMVGRWLAVCPQHGLADVMGFTGGGVWVV
jgi:hypothetical protein